MANHQIANAHLNGWRGPFFPPSIKRPHLAYAAKPRSNNFLLRVAQDAKLPTLEQGPQITSDGYQWYCSLEVYDETLVMLLFPNCRDKEKVNGTSTDRHVALYLPTTSSDPSAEDPKVTLAIDLISTRLEAL
ncbi:MAG TPA: hypothetical protein VG102_00845 [Candidatus Paceibacterota bacterium]|jgi:hypothetical protein|nr:hypothetical protein [Candidatus Paceibacterota bacterium]